MAESEACCPSRDNNSHNDLTESDMAAAYQLMLLSDEDNNHSIMGKRNRSFVDEEEEEEVDQRNRSFVDDEEEEVDQVLRHLIPTKINKIFWKDEVLVTKKQRRYRSLQHIYMVTTPIHA
ncbi:hypothetical protein K1719_015280 [Acacia pycnantha]|nr:hypothetical protein K1719_015280 [Acacia pycnantha]